MDTPKVTFLLARPQYHPLNRPWIPAVRRFDDKEYEVSYTDLPRLSVNDVEDMYLLQVQQCSSHVHLKNRDQEQGQRYSTRKNLIDMLSKNKLGSGNKRLKGRDWTDYDVKSSKEMLKKIDETLRHKEKLRRLDEYVGGRPKTVNPCPSQAKTINEEIHEGSCRFNVEPCSMGLNILEPLPTAPGSIKFLAIAVQHSTKWAEAKPLTKVNGRQLEKFVWEHIICKFGVPQTITSKDKKQFTKGIFIDFCKGLKTVQSFTLVTEHVEIMIYIEKHLV
ncbi:reverse transcriptase domain-containing protein [Tanacetum coccineum]